MKNQKNYTVGLIKELDRAYKFFNDKFADGLLPESIITISRDTNRKAFGWFCPNSWADSSNNAQIHEITLCQSAFINGTNEVFDTLLHEMAHIYNFVINESVVDCTDQQRHNKIFKATAEKFGLVVTSSKRFGYGHTSLGTIAVNVINELAPDYSVYALAAGIGAQALKDKKEKARKDKKQSKTAAVIIGRETKEKIASNAKELGTTSKSLTEKAVEFYLDMLKQGKVPKKYLTEPTAKKDDKKS